MTAPLPADRPEKRSSVQAFAERFSLPLFFGLASLFTGAVVLLDVLVPTEPLLRELVYPFAAYGPFAAALALSALRSPGRRLEQPDPARYGFAGAALALAVYLNWGLLGRIPASAHPPLAYTLWALRVLTPAAVFGLAGTRVAGVRTWLHSLLGWRVGIWYVVALLIFAAASLTGMGVIAIMGRPLPPLRLEGFAQRLPHLFTVFLGTLFYGGPLGEEPGWRGFALPRLQRRFSPLVASLILGALWGTWHVPFHLHGDYRGVYADGLTGLAFRVFTAVGLTIVFTWLYNRTGGNLLLAVVLHTAVNNTLGVWLPAHPGVFPGVFVLIALLVGLDKMYRPLPTLGDTGHPQTG